MTERSGKARWVHHRLACPKFLKQTFHEFADQSIRCSQWARAYYDQQRGRGNDHHAALRALAYKGMRDRDTLATRYPLEGKTSPAGAVNPALQQLDFYIRSPERNEDNHPDRDVFDHFFAMEVTWK